MGILDDLRSTTKKAKLAFTGLNKLFLEPVFKKSVSTVTSLPNVSRSIQGIKTGGSLVKTIGQGLLRQFESFGRTVPGSRLGPKVKRETPLTKKLFGEDDLIPVGERGVRFTTGFEDFGFSPKTAQVLGVGANLALVGLEATDVIFPGKAALVKKLGKEGLERLTKEFGEQAVKNFIKGGGDDAIKLAAKNFLGREKITSLTDASASSITKFFTKNSKALENFTAFTKLRDTMTKPLFTNFLKKTGQTDEFARSLKVLRKSDEAVDWMTRYGDEGIEGSVIQAVRPGSNEKYFWIVPKGGLDEFKRTIDGGIEGISGPQMDGFIYHLTAKPPVEMVGQGFQLAGKADSGFVKDISKVGAGIFESANDVVGGLTSNKTALNESVQKITQALKEAKPISKLQAKSISSQKAGRFAIAEAAGKAAGGGQEAFFKELSKLKGEFDKVDFQSIAGKIDSKSIDDLFKSVVDSKLLYGQKLTARTGLLKLLGKAGGAIPNNSELKYLNEVFGSEFVEAAVSNRSILAKYADVAAEVLNIPRALMASADVSAPFRQGVFLIGRPKRFFGAFGDMFKAAFSQKHYDELMQSIASRETYPMMLDAGLDLTDLGKLGGREEAFMSNLAEKIPGGIGSIVKGSNRAYSGFLNKLRADVFDDILQNGAKLGKDATEGSVFAKDLARFVNSATGRGSLGKLEGAAPILNSAFFSPKLIASRINLLNPVFYAKLDPLVRKEALKSLFTFVGTGLSVLTLAKLAGADVGDDPRSADFGKIKVGRTRYDVWGGFQQYTKIVAQLLTGEIVSSRTGKKLTLGEGFKPITRKDIVYRFGEQKTSPIVSFAIGLSEGRNMIGEKFDVSKETLERFVPLVLQDVQEIVEERGPGGLPMLIPGFFGVGTQTYDTPTDKKINTTPFSSTKPLFRK